MKTTIASVLTAAVLSALSSSALGAVITWSSPTTVSGDSDVSTAFPTFGAWHFLNGGANTSVNGVTFTDFFSSINGQALASGQPNFTGGDNEGNSIGAFGGDTSPFTSLSSGYQTLLSRGLFKADGNSATTLTLNGLTIGQQYRVQIWVNDSRDLPNVWQRTALIADGIGGNFSGPLSYNAAQASGGVGQFVIGTFTADATSQLLLISSDNPQVNGLYVTVVPEPSTVVLTLFAAASLIGIRARHMALRKNAARG